ncbi:nitrate- and nitrite sensing domain-containing protein [Streptomyces sp. LP05-1]|uniref:histidine kinase n=1 Tax=Streptomyces pyxinae TaxID=2970734 RepID=A0ABT2CQ43_9ACTN|nr:nitrate- and nitrite sensing domain-containing protein [Streptomyces sp. LP05-1]
MRFRGKSIRRKIVALLLVPLLSLTGLWGFATLLTGREARQLLDVGQVLERVGYPVEQAVRVMQKERRQSLVYLADPRASEALSALQRERAATDRALDVIRESARDPGVADAMTPRVARRLDALVGTLDGLETLRRSVEARSVGRSQALEYYNDLVDPCYAFLMALHAVENVEMDKQARALVGLVRAREMLAQEDALVVSSLLTGRFTAQDTRSLTDLVAKRQVLYETNLELLPTVEHDTFGTYWSGPGTEPLRVTENALIAAGPTDDPGTGAERWRELADPVLDRLAVETDEAAARFEERVAPIARSVLLRAGIAGVLGFAALVASLVVSVRVGRGLVRDLRRLRKEAQEVSGVRLPSVMRRLAAGEHVDIETEVPRLEYERDEIGQVGQALNTLQRAAVEAAVRQADLRRGVSEVFVNLARRNQVLLHRQLTLLDTMERRTEDAGELADLFRLDHMTTRMRRHAEGLVILSGAAPSRQWRRPVQLMDVVRAAVAEVEDYERIEVRRLPRIGVGGPAVADLTHLVAELLENATVFSPPHTTVHVHGERVANGFTLELDDRGLGMPPDALLDANLRLAETPEFELSDTDRLGLFVVSRLAQRQNVRVSLQPSPYGGITAVVFIPAALLTDPPETQGSGFRLDRATAPPAGERRSPVRAGGPRRPSRPGGPADPEAYRPGAEEPYADADTDDAFATRRAGAGQHQQAAEPSDPGAGQRLPRRHPPTLVAEYGQRVYERGRAHPSPGRPIGPPAHGAEDLAVPGSGGPEGPAAPGAPGPVGPVAPGVGGPPAPAASGAGGSPGPAAPGTPGPEAPAASAAEPGPGRPGLPAAPGAPATGAAWPELPAPRAIPPVRPELPAPGPVPPGAVPPGRPAPAPGRSTPGDPELGGLPRRVRQASLIPQLRELPAPPEPVSPGVAGTGPADPDGGAERDADEVRRRMAAMQRGWQRGRRQNEAPEAVPDGHTHGHAHASTQTPPHTDTASGGRGGTAPGTTPGGNGR